MKKQQHLFLEIPKASFQDGTLPEVLDDGLVLPKRVFPQSFKVKEKDFFCGGYFACYDGTVTIDDLVKACRRDDWKFLSDLVGDFLILYCDFVKSKLFVFTGQGGKFPCFFSTENGKLVLSPDFETVKDKQSSLTLNVGASLDFISRMTLLTDETVISGIKQVPPGTLLRINKDLSFSLMPLVNLDNFLSQKSHIYTSSEEFSNDFLSLLGQIIAEQLQLVKNLSFGADISSGFDSPLVCYLLKKQTRKAFTCYSGISKYTTSDTDPQIVNEFAHRHALKVKFVNEEHFYPLSETDLEWASRLPGQIGYGLMYNFHSQVAADGTKIEFLGEGGDEVYKSASMDLLAQFPIQEEYFWTVKRLKLGLGRVVSKKGIRILLDKVHFQGKKPFFSIIAPSATLVNLELFPVFWETGVWPVTPFTDPRLIQLARRIPRQSSKILPKQEIWRTRMDIFVPSQFRSKQGPVGHVQLFLEKKQKLVTSVLRGSILAQHGLIQASEIISDVERGNIQKYLEGDTISFLLNTLKLEYFLQHNKVKIPN